MLLVLVLLAVLAPYLWLQSGPLSYVAGNALVLVGAAILVVWTASGWPVRSVARPRLRSRPGSRAWLGRRAERR